MPFGITTTQKPFHIPSPLPQVPIVFMGTPHFAAHILSTLLDAGFNVVGVVTQPDRKVGRKHEVTASPVKELALKRAIPVLQPVKLDQAALDALRAWKPDLIVVAAYGRILPQALLDLPGLGCVNVHASLLPRWRGASPVQNALIAGDTETGITLMQVEAGLDTGPIIAKRPLDISPDERAPELMERLTLLAGTFLVETLPLWIKRRITAEPQSEVGVTLCQLIDREDGRIFWSVSSEEIYNRYRGLYPWPGIFTFWKRTSDDMLRIKLIEIGLQKVAPLEKQAFGTVIEAGEKIGIVTGSGLILLETIQPEGKSAIPVRDFIQGNPEFVGAVLQ